MNDYFTTTTSAYAMSLEENKQLTIQWHTVLCHLLMKYKLSCILIEHLDIHTSMFDTIIGKRDEKSSKHNIKQHQELFIPFSEFAFGRLMNSEHYIKDWNDQLEYRQLRTNDIINFHYETKFSSNLLSLFHDEQLNDNYENILARIVDHKIS